ncbi:MAG: hypothetical protein HY526_04705 [Betaproteobacteria bacterium]|nr:hypothetical protein [Betaproteobacteria bacterium]
MTGSRQIAARVPWYRSESVWTFIALRFIPLLALFSLSWEAIQLPLYTIWYQAEWADIAYAVVHCTAGDVLIGLFALFTTLVATRAGPIGTWRTAYVAAGTVALTVSYTVFSEWMNTVVHENWTYSSLMPLLPVLGTGLSPLLQWVIVPSLALHMALRVNRALASKSN